MKNPFIKGASLLMVSLALAACSENNANPDVDPTPVPSYTARFVVTATNKNAAFLLATEDLSKGQITTVGNGLTVDAPTNQVTWNGQQLFGFIYKQGNPASAESYVLSADGKPAKTGRAYEVKRYTTIGLYGDYVLSSEALDLDERDAAGNVAKGIEVSALNAKTGALSTKVLRGENFLGNGEYVRFAGFQQSGSLLYTGVIPMGLSIYGSSAEGGKYVHLPDLVAKADGGEKSSSYKKGELQWTQYPNEAWVAIFDDMDVTKKPKLIRTDKISYPAGRFKSQYYQMIWPDDNGDLYVFSPNFSRIYYWGAEQRSSLPAGVVRIRKGQKEFDPNYYVNLEAQADGHSFIRVWPAGGSRFLLQLFSGDMGKNAEGADQLAIFDASTQKLTRVTGLPASGTYSFSLTVTPLVDGGKIYFPVNHTNANPAIYVIDPVTAKAVKGVEVEATEVKGVARLILAQ